MAFYIGYSYVDGELYQSADEYKLLAIDRKMLIRRLAPTHDNIQALVDQFCWENEITNPPLINLLDKP